MIEEVSQAITFLKALLTNGIPHSITSLELDRFTRKLRELLLQRFETHWDPKSPAKGSGYRCIRINHRLDPIVLRACQESGTVNKVPSILPKELTVWIDPQEVAYRFGEEGSICKLEPSPPPSPKATSPEPTRREEIRLESPSSPRPRSSRKRGSKKPFLVTGSVTSQLLPRQTYEDLSLNTISVNA